jgi:hypothetical protein
MGSSGGILVLGFVDFPLSKFSCWIISRKSFRLIVLCVHFLGILICMLTTLARDLTSC